jgi:hypothetical protein
LLRSEEGINKNHSRITITSPWLPCGKQISALMLTATDVPSCRYEGAVFASEPSPEPKAKSKSIYDDFDKPEDEETHGKSLVC